MTCSLQLFSALCNCQEAKLGEKWQRRARPKYKPQEIAPEIDLSQTRGALRTTTLPLWPGVEPVAVGPKLSSSAAEPWFLMPVLARSAYWADQLGER